MDPKGIILTSTDKIILESYRNLVQGLADYLSEGYEIVLHSLESLENSVIEIANGEHTGRKRGSPITDLALNMMKSIRQDDKGYISYYSQNRNGEPLQSSTIVIYGENKRIIGLLCINLYLNTPFYKIVGPLVNHATSTQRPVMTETFVDNADDLLTRIVGHIKQEVDLDGHILPSMKNKEIIQRCNNHGVFQIKSAVNSVAQILGISKNTVYLHLKSSD